MRVFTQSDAAALIDRSEDQIVDPSAPDIRGHAYVHVGPPNVPIMETVWRRKLTTMYRNRSQAEKDLRDLLNKHSHDLDVLPNGNEARFTEILREGRQAHVAEPGGEKYSYAGTKVTNTTKQKLFVKIVKTPAGELHLRTMFLMD